MNATQVDAENFTPVLLIQLVNLSLFARDAGVVDGNVQPAEARYDLRQHFLDLFGLADVEF